MSIFDGVTTRVARALPVILLVDVSGSMSDQEKIKVCNQSVRVMLEEFKRSSNSNSEIQVAVIAFGGDEARVHLPLSSVFEAQWHDLEARGRTPMGDAFRLAAIMVEDRAQLPERCYQPTIVLISDGIPTDDWETSLLTLEASERASRALRLAVAIGMEPEDAQYKVLQRFVQHVPGRVYTARDAHVLPDALRWVTFSVAQRLSSKSPDDPSTWDLGEPDF